MPALAIIPARGGSKRIPRKNIRDFSGVPVIAYSIRAALQSGCFDEVMVSTDDPEIAEVALQWGAAVPFMRSQASSDDYATTADVIREVLAEYAFRGREFGTFACIYATAPFVTASRLKEGMGIVASGSAGAAFTCVRYSYPTQRSLVVSDAGRIAMQFPQYALSRSQDLPATYHDAGQFYVCSRTAFEVSGSLWGPDTVPIVLPELEVQDLDTPVDWKLAELKYGLLSFPKEIAAGGFLFRSYPLLSHEESLRMLAGRNSEDVRLQMIDRDIITSGAHEAFVDSLRTRRDKAYYAVYTEVGELLGSVTLEDKGEGTVERGIWLFPTTRGRGMAASLLRPLYSYLGASGRFKEVLTTVRTANIPSLALEASLGAERCGCDSEFVYFKKDIAPDD